MENRWDAVSAKLAGEDGLSQRVYSSRLLGMEPTLVLHGGGNTSVKTTEQNILGDAVETLWVKGSGWDLATITAKGYAPTRLQDLQRLAALPSMTDTDMMRELRVACTDPAAPAPSVEAILHAIIPLRFVDHTHADAVVAISNTPQGETHLRDLYGDDVLILPYVMPGFILAKQVYEATQNLDWRAIKGIILLHHGVFTFSDDAHTSYANMIELVNKAERYLQTKTAWDAVASGEYTPTVHDLQSLAAMRQRVSAVAGRPMLAMWDIKPDAVGYAALENVEVIATRGPITPDHTLHTKPVPMVFQAATGLAVDRFADAYRAYFSRHAKDGLVCLDSAPRVGVWRDKGMVYFAQNAKRVGIVRDIATHTRRAVQWGEVLGGWTALPEQDLFELEYWELEQAKLKSQASMPSMEGRVALVTGAASGIGKACVEALMKQGAAVLALDINPSITTLFAPPVMGMVCDVTCSEQVQQCVAAAVMQYGGIDMLVSNAGCFPASAPVAALSMEALQTSLSLNFTSHLAVLQACEPFLSVGIDPAVVIVASKNVPAPGPGAAAYSTAKAALTQLARVTALEWGEKNIRVNVVHPNAVFDTAIWDAGTLQKRAEAYGLSVDAYKTNNVLQCEVTSARVAAVVMQLCSPVFACTTGAQIPVDGGNDRVI